MKKILLSVAFVLACVGCAQTEVPSRESTQQLITAMSGGEVTEKSISQDVLEGVVEHLPEFKELYPEKPAEFWDKFANDLNSQFRGFYISLYQKHLTQQDVDELLALYSSPLGKKLDKVYYMLASEETSEAMEAWAADLGRQLLENQYNENGLTHGKYSPLLPPD